MSFLKNLSIVQKLRRMIMLTSGLALLVASLVYIAIDIASYRQSMIERISVLADFIATTSLTLDDKKTANALLRSLKTEQTIIGASIFKENGKLFSIYAINDRVRLMMLEEDAPWRRSVLLTGTRGYRDVKGGFDLISPIVLDSHVMGFVQIEATFAPLYQRIAYFLLIVLTLCLLIMAGIYFISKRLLRHISAPINGLVAGMQQVFNLQDFSLRLQPGEKDEIGTIIAGFNMMLEAREAAESASRAKGEVLASMSQEIHTPMNGVLGMTELLLESGLDERARRRADTAHRTAESLQDVRIPIIDDYAVKREILHNQVANQTTSASAPTTLQGRILLAEDNPVNQEVSLTMLQILGTENSLAQDGVEALEYATKTTYDIILMDCHMPVMDGFSASSEIRQIEQMQRRSRVPIIALTANVQKGIQEQCQNAGMDDYLSKPFNQAQLEEMLKKWLPTQTIIAETPSEEEEPHTLSADDVLDPQALNQLRELGKLSGSDLLGKSIGYYLQQTPEEIARLQDALEAQDPETLRRIAHSLKSGSANLGAMSLSADCAKLETLASEERLEQAPPILEHILNTLPQVLAALRDIVSDTSQMEDENPTQPASGAKLLMVDDDPGFRLTTRDALTSAGFTVIEAVNGHEAIQSIQQEQPDLVMLDALMDDMDGFEVCRRLHEMPEFNNIPILMVTGLDDMDSVNRAYDSGAVGFITKPLNYTLVIHHLRFQLRTAAIAKSLVESREQLSTAQRIARLGYWRWNCNKDYFELSEHLADMLGATQRRFGNKLEDYIELIHPEDRDHIMQQIINTKQGAPLEPADYRLLTDELQTITVHQELDLISNGDQIILGTIQDISEQRKAEQRIRQLAYSDELTGLASRAYFYTHIDDVIKAAQRREERFALLYLDLDGFKDVNDSLGHDVGDLLLQTVARRIQSILRPADFVARLSGDEFCILVDNVTSEYDAADVANRCLSSINQPVQLSTQQFRPRSSIGIAYYPDDGEDLQTLLKAADSAMYAAKAEGKHRYAFYQPELTTQAEQRLQIEEELRQAVEQGQLELHYQPQISLLTGKLMGVEALVRWRRPRMGLVPPNEFIGIAERIGIIKPLGDWVLKTACKQAASWRAMGLTEFRMAVNISPIHFQDPIIVQTVVQTLEETGLPAANLELEITESVVQTTAGNLDIFNQLKTFGISIAIDDFGTGYSSLGSLKKLPIDCLKIDRLFVTDMLQDPNSSILLGTIVGVAQALGHRVVAEGVETLDQLRALRGIGCDVAQGFYFSRPVTDKEIPAFMKARFLPTKGEDRTLVNLLSNNTSE